MFLKNNQFITILIIQIFLSTSFINGMINEKEIEIKKLWATLESNKVTDLALEKSAYISENIDSNLTELTASVGKLGSVDSRKVKEPYTVVINLLDALNQDCTMGKELSLVRKITELARKYLFVAIMRMSRENVQGTRDAVHERLKLLKKRYKGSRQSGIYYEIGMMLIEKELLDSIRDKEELQEHFFKIATQLFSGGVTTGASIASTALTGTLPSADSLPLENAYSIFLNSFAIIRKYSNKIKLLNKFEKWIKLNEQGKKALESKEELKKFFELISIKKLALKKPHWRILYKALDTLYLIIKHSKNDEIKKLAFKRLIDFTNFNEFKFRNNWRVRQKAAECLILLSDLKKSILPEEIINKSNDLINERKKKDKSNKNQETDKRVLYYLCRRKQILAGEALFTNIKEVEKFIDKKEEEKSDFKNISQIKRTRERYWKDEKNTDYYKEIEDLYINLKGKERIDYPDELRFNLLPRVNEFLEGDKKILLLSGNAGAGKSTFTEKLERDIWGTYKQDSYIPVYIRLSLLRDPVTDLIKETLEKMGISRKDAVNLKNEKFLFILDGYDELKKDFREEYLYNTNNFEEWGNSKIIITCRSEYLNNKTAGLICTPYISEEIYITPFDEEQRNEYLKRFIKKNNPGWELEKYISYIEQIQGMDDLAKVPITLKMVAEELPQIIKEHEKESKGKRIKISRKKLYEQFIKSWFKREFDKLSNAGNLKGVDTEYFEHYAKKLAEKMHEDNKAEFTYFKKNKWTEEISYWDKVFDDSKMYPEYEKEKCFHALPLRRIDESGYTFWHLTFRDYFANKGCEEIIITSDEKKQEKFISKGILEKETLNEKDKKIREEKINQAIENDSRGLVNLFIERINHDLEEEDRIKFMADSIEETPGYKEILFKIIEKSKKDKGVSIAAANAITALNVARISFSGMDFEGISIPGADLTGTVMDSTNLKGSDLSNVKLRASWLKNADLRNCNMQGVKFGEQAYIDVGSEVNSVSYSPDGRRLATGGCEGVRLWDTATGNHISTLKDLTGKHITTRKGHTGGVYSVDYSPDGRRLATGGGDYKFGEVRIWDGRTGKHITTRKGLIGVVLSVSYSPDGRRLATGSDQGIVRIWDAETTKHITTLKGHIYSVTSVRYSPDGRSLATGSYDNTVRLWDAATGKHISTLKGHTSEVTSVSYSPDGRRLATGSWDKTVRIWDAETGKHITTLKGHTSDVNSVSYSPDGRSLATGSRDKTVRIWDMETGKQITTLKGHTDWVRSVSYSPDGRRLATGSADETVRIWDVDTGKHISTLKGHITHVTSVSYSPDGRRMATVSEDHTVMIWDVDTGKQITTLKGHTGWVRSVSYSPDGRRLATGSWDKTVRIWDVETGKHITTLKGHINSVYSVSYSPDGRSLATGSDDNSVKVWDLRPLEEGKEPTLIWNGTRTTALFLEGGRIEGVQGLSENNRRLVEQRTKISI